MNLNISKHRADPPWTYAVRRYEIVECDHGLRRAKRILSSRQLRLWQYLPFRPPHFAHSRTTIQVDFRIWKRVYLVVLHIGA